jgi:hypothetical protein
VKLDLQINFSVNRCSSRPLPLHSSRLPSLVEFRTASRCSAVLGRFTPQAAGHLSTPTASRQLALLFAGASRVWAGRQSASVAPPPLCSAALRHPAVGAFPQCAHPPPFPHDPADGPFILNSATAPILAASRCALGRSWVLRSAH